MSDRIEPGTSATVQRVVDDDQCTTRGQHDIFSTPNLVLLLEEAAIEAIAPYLRDDQACVGSRVDVAHLAATLKGQTVRATATVTAVDRRKVTFDVVAEDDQEQIGRGTHERFVIDVPKFEQRLTEKAASLR